MYATRFSCSGVTDGGRGKCPPGSSDVGLFLETGPLIRLSLLSKQLYKLETFNLYKFVFCYCSSVLQSFAQGLF